MMLNLNYLLFVDKSVASIWLSFHVPLKETHIQQPDLQLSQPPLQITIHTYYLLTSQGNQCDLIYDVICLPAFKSVPTWHQTPKICTIKQFLGCRGQSVCFQLHRVKLFHLANQEVRSQIQNTSLSLSIMLDCHLSWTLSPCTELLDSSGGAL